MSDLPAITVLTELFELIPTLYIALRFTEPENIHFSLCSYHNIMSTFKNERENSWRQPFPQPNEYPKDE
jgi:hypothetical protein